MPDKEKNNTLTDEEYNKAVEEDALLKSKRAEEAKKTEQEYLSEMGKKLFYDKADPERYLEKAALSGFLRQQKEKLFPDFEGESIPVEKEARREYFVKLAESLSAEDKDSFRDPLFEENKDPLKQVFKDIDLYLKLDLTGNLRSKMLDGNIEDQLVHRIYRRLNKVYEQTLGDPNADDERIFSVANFLNYFEGEVNGKLGMDPAMPENENDIHIRYTGQFIANDEDELETAVEAAMRKTALEDDLKANGDKKTKEEKEKIEKKITEYDELLKSNVEEFHKNRPLFPHSPSPQDVVQGPVGDCYFVATLCEIAAKRPDRIKEMMRDNGDGTATVRFFYKNNDTQKTEPLYVTVDKVASKSQARGSEWVQTLERALAVSGLMTSYHYLDNNDIEGNPQPVPENIQEIYNDYLERAKRDPKTPKPSIEKYPWLYQGETLTGWRPDYNAISSGRAEAAMDFLFGDDAAIEYLMDNKKADQSKIPQNDQDLQPIDIKSTKYNAAAEDLFKKITENCKENNIVTAATYAAKNSNSDLKKVVGINKKHAYAVLGTETVEFEVDGEKKPVKFIKLRNPHGRVGRTYIKTEDNKLQAVENTSFDEQKETMAIKRYTGYCYVELNQFMKEFRKVSVGKVKESTLERNNHIAAAENKINHSYRKAFHDVLKYLDSKDKFFTKDSDEYKDLHSKLKDYIDHFPMERKELLKKTNELRESIAKFDAHVVRRKKGEDNERRNAKIKACSIMKDLIDNQMLVTVNGENGPEKVFNTSLANPYDSLKDKIAENTLDKVMELPSDNEKTQKMQSRIRDNRNKAKSELKKSTGFKQWVKQNADYVMLYEQEKTGVTFKNVTQNQLEAEAVKDRKAVKYNKVEEVLKGRVRGSMLPGIERKITSKLEKEEEAKKAEAQNKNQNKNQNKEQKPAEPEKYDPKMEVQFKM